MSIQFNPLSLMAVEPLARRYAMTGPSDRSLVAAHLRAFARSMVLGSCYAACDLLEHLSPLVVSSDFGEKADNILEELISEGTLPIERCSETPWLYRLKHLAQ